MTSAAVSLLKEANLKVVLAGFDCLENLIKLRKESIGSLISMTFDVLVPRLGDTKVSLHRSALCSSIISIDFWCVDTLGECSRSGATSAGRSCRFF